MQTVMSRPSHGNAGEQELGNTDVPHQVVTLWHNSYTNTHIHPTGFPKLPYGCRHEKLMVTWEHMQDIVECHYMLAQAHIFTFCDHSECWHTSLWAYMFIQVTYVYFHMQV